jgi:intraflagellar transport protein 74
MGRQTTAGKGASGASAAYIPNVAGHGDMRLQTGIGTAVKSSQGSNRVNYDRTYYVSKMREKLTALIKENEAIKKRAEQVERDRQLFAKQETRHEELLREVRNLEGDLADLNLALDKLRLNTRPEEVNFAYQHVRSQNEKRRSELDSIYMERKKLED